MKSFIFDTNVLLHDPFSLKYFKNANIVIPMFVLEELDGAKKSDSLGRNAREAIRILDGLRNKGSLSEGVKYEDSTIRVEVNYQDNIISGLSKDKADNKIINIAIKLKEENEDVTVITKDINLRVKCSVLGIMAEDYNNDKITDNLDSIYGGVQKIIVPSSTINKFYEDGFLETEFSAYPNQFFVLKSEDNGVQSAIARYTKGKLIPLRKTKNVMGITPRNMEQKMAIDLLLDPEIKLVTLSGLAGSGKTLIAVAAALENVLERKTYDRIVISRPIQVLGNDIGFLPGSLMEKIRPYLQPIYDNLELVLGVDYQTVYDENIIQAEALTYIRGRSISRSLFILDEAQNISIHEIKTVVTRIGFESKIIITGDISQIDNNYLDYSNSGLTHVIEKFKDYDIAGHITFRKSERSELASLASQIL